MSRCLLRGVDEAVYGVHGARPFTVEGFIDEHKKGGDGVVVVLVEHEGIEDPIEVRRALELGNAAAGHEDEQGQDEVAVVAQYEEGLAGEFLEATVVRAFALAPENPLEVGREHEGRRLSLDAELLLVVAEEVAEVDVQEAPHSHDHDVVVVAVADAEHIGRDAVAREGPGEVVEGQCQGPAEA